MRNGVALHVFVLAALAWFTETARGGDCYGMSCHPMMYCVTQSSCGGSALTGQCQPQGFVCAAGDCYPAYAPGTDPNNVCSWSFTAECWGPGLPDTFCVLRDEYYMAMGCSPSCTLIFYNQCACQCRADIRSGESGCSRSCHVYSWNPCNP